MCPVSSLKVLFWNARGIINKLIEFEKYICDNYIDIACVCETFLCDKKDIRINGYRCVYENRISGRFGGLLIIVKEGIPFKPLNLPPTQLLECLGITTNNTNFILVYLPGQSSDGLINSHLLGPNAWNDQALTSPGACIKCVTAHAQDLEGNCAFWCFFKLYSSHTVDLQEKNYF